MAMVEASSMLIVPMARHTAMAVGESVKNRNKPRKQIDAGGHHGCRMQQGADRRGALHGVGQPGEQRELGAFADDAAENQQGGQRDHAGRQLRSHGCGVGQHRDVQVPRCSQSSTSPSRKATSPVRVITKAFLPASLALNLSNQNPMSR